MARRDKLTFSQRTGLAPIPSQLKLGEVPQQLRALIWAVFDDSINASANNFTYPRLGDDWHRILKDYWVEVLNKKSHEFQPLADKHKDKLSELVFYARYNVLFDLLEYVMRHPACPRNFAKQIGIKFESGRAAYRIVDGSTILPIGNEVEAESIESGIVESSIAELDGARSHLVSAVEDARRGDWAGSVRESISAVESVAIRLAPDTSTLGAALAKLEAAGHLHGALKSAFGKLYGFSSDEDGVRHALVFEDKANVDEADALFMLGACASFVSYLISKGRSLGLLSH